MDGSCFDAWTRRRFGLAAGGLAAALLALDPPWSAVAKKKKQRKKKRRNKKKCGKHKKRCNGQCIPRSQCCRDSECSVDAYCCEGACVSRETCCGGNPCDEACPCRRTVEGDQACVAKVLVICAQCESSEDCGPGERCVLTSCGDVTAACRPLCAM